MDFSKIVVVINCSVSRRRLQSFIDPSWEMGHLRTREKRILGRCDVLKHESFRTKANYWRWTLPSKHWLLIDMKVPNVYDLMNRSHPVDFRNISSQLSSSILFKALLNPDLIREATFTWPISFRTIISLASVVGDVAYARIERSWDSVIGEDNIMSDGVVAERG